MTDFLSEYAAYELRYGQPDRFELMLCDVHGIWRGKWFNGTDADKIMDGQARMPLSAYAPTVMGYDAPGSGLGIVNGDPDGILEPVEDSLCRVPWAEGHVAQLQVEMRDTTGATSWLSTRQILVEMLDRFQSQSLQPVLATELEFYVYPARAHTDSPPMPPEHSPRAQNYELNILTRNDRFLTDIQNSAIAQGLPTDTLIAEFGPGQFEINFKHTDDVLFAADAALLFRRLVRGVALRHGLEATFAAKPYANHPGNGMHAHISILDKDGENIFACPEGPNDKLLAAVSGALATMTELQLVFAPHLNSYRRFQKGSFAPTAPNWGYDHRGAGIRLPSVSGPAARMEHRICGADVNPYLTITAILGGMLLGLQNPFPLPLPLDDPKAQPADPLTHDWLTAIENFEESKNARDFFGNAFVDLFAVLKREELATLTTVISPIEYSTYLARF